MHFGIYTLFTKFRQRPSTRLRRLARALQWYGIAIGVATAGLVLLILTAPNSRMPRQFGDASILKLLLTGGLQCASLIIIGRELLRRKRWAGYLAAVTLAVPILSRLGSAHPFQTQEILIAVVAVGTLITVSKELRSVRELDFMDDDAADDVDPDRPDPVPNRRRGNGERRDHPNDSASVSAANSNSGESGYRVNDPAPRALFPEKIPTPTSSTERTPEPTRNPRDS